MMMELKRKVVERCEEEEGALANDDDGYGYGDERGMCEFCLVALVVGSRLAKGAQGMRVDGPESLLGGEAKGAN